MKTKVNRKLLSAVVLCTLLFVSVFSTASAQSINVVGDTNDGVLIPKNISEDIVPDVAEDAISSLDEAGFYIGDIATDTDENIMFDVSVGDSEGTITIMAATDEELLMAIEEDGLYNEVMLSDEGKVYLNGEEVVVETTIVNEHGQKEIRANAQYAQMTTACPYGSSSDYTLAAPTTQVRFEVKSGVAMLGGVALGVILTGVAVSVGIALVASSAYGIVSYCILNNINPTWIAISTINKYHKNGFPRVPVIKHTPRCFFNSSYTGQYLALDTSYTRYVY